MGVLCLLECTFYQREQNSVCIRTVSNVSFVRDPRCKFEKSLEASAVSSADRNGIIKEAFHGYFCRARVHTVSHPTVSNHLHS